MDLSRGKVDCVMGHRPKFAEETADLVRTRLWAATLAMLAVLLVSFVVSLIQGHFYLWWLRASVLLFLAASLAMLARRVTCSLTGLRRVELWIFGLVLFQLGFVFASRMLAFAEQGDRLTVSAVHHLFLGAATVLLFIYAIFIPNAWKRGLVVLLSGAAIPYLILWMVRWYSPEVNAALAQEGFAMPIPLPLVSALVGVFGLHVINSARQEAFKARQFGQYRLKEKLGAGGMGVVFKAEHTLLKRPCAIKLIQPSKETNDRALAMFEKEVKATARLTHWNTVDIYDYGRTEDGTFYYVMELLDGKSLKDLVDGYGPMPPGRVVYLLMQVCEALSEAHCRNLIHRDIKPANIFAAQRGGRFDTAKLLDFGLVKEKSHGGQVGNEADDQRSFSGTPMFMSPEQAFSYDDVDGRADLYSLSAVGYFLLTGQPPFTGNDVLKILAAHANAPVPRPTIRNGQVPADLEKVILRGLAKRPDERFPDALAMQRELEQCGCRTDWSVQQAADWWKGMRDLPVKATPAALQETQISNPPTR